MNESTETILDFTDLLLGSLGYTADELVSLIYWDADDTPHTAVLPPADAIVAAAKLPQTANAFYGVNPTRGPARKGKGRGTEADVTRLAALPVDLDFKPGGCPSRDVALAIIAELGIILGTRPSAIVDSGHGVHAYWPISDGQITDGDIVKARALLKRFGRLVAHVAAKHNVHADNVFDLARVMRLPGSHNNKSTTNGEAPILVTAHLEPGGPLTMTEVDERLTEVGIVERPGDSAAASSVAVSPPANWAWAAQTCGYATRMIDAWETDSPPTGARNPFIYGQHVRLFCAHRNGCLTEADYLRGLATLSDRLSVLVRANPSRKVRKYEIADMVRYGLDRAASHTDDEGRAELGGHDHGNVHFVSFSAFPGKATASAKKARAEFWEASDELRRLRDFARSRRVGPFAMLGPVMARVVAAARPTVQIPPYVGANASLNLFFNLVAQSGGRKGATLGAARDAVLTAPIHVTGPGSGEGINHLFAYYDKKTDSTVFRQWGGVFFSVPEVDTLANLSSRNGATLLSQLCKAWSGESLTFAYVDRTKALDIPDHSYRLCMVVGVQPGRAGALLDATDAGVPQRFLWLPTDDPDAPDVRPNPPAPLDCREAAKYWPETGKPVRLLNLPAAAEAQINQDALLKLRGKGDPALDGHLGLCRIKVAAALMMLHPRPWEISDLHWDLSKVVMEVSQETRARVETYLVAKSTQEERRRGKREGVRAVAAESVKADVAIKQVIGSIERYLRNHGETPRGVVRRDSTSTRTRDYFDEALERLIDAGQVEVVSGARGDLLRLVSP